ncbi:MAG: STAS/SEC14 domain-containing protein [Paracoccaceae bacterium]|nr:STAS/SEC14 domain-containing protein [Paracoccaceae bacterium]
MFTVSKPKANRLDLVFSGTLNEETMRVAIDTLIEESQGITNGKMLYKIVDFQMPTVAALVVEFQQLPKLLSLLGKFDKCAVLSDDAWIRTAAEIESAIVPSCDIKAFTLSAVDDAEDWLEGSVDGKDDDEDAGNFPV